MQKLFSELKFYESYYLSQAVQNILYNRFEYIRGLNDFYGDGNQLSYIRPFPKFSALHSFIEFVVSEIIHEENHNIDLEKRKENLKKYANIPSALEYLCLTKLPIEDAFTFYEINHVAFEEWLQNDRSSHFTNANEDDVCDYLEELLLSEEYDLLIDSIVREVFFILFQNRNLLLVFNDMMANQIAEIHIEELEEEDLHFFSSSGKLKRISIPTWVKSAVFFRDRGKCVLCNKDLTGLMNIDNVENYDHIVPLAQGGLNDVTNIQLLCKECNAKKLHYQIETSTNYQLWYPLD